MIQIVPTFPSASDAILSKNEKLSLLIEDLRGNHTEFSQNCSDRGSITPDGVILAVEIIDRISVNFSSTEGLFMELAITLKGLCIARRIFVTS